MQGQQLYINDQLADLSDASFIALTLQVNDLGNLKDRQSTFTNAIKLPKTANNSQLLGQAQSDAFTQQQPYRVLSAKIIQNGVETIAHGQITLLRVSDSFECQITYGLKGFGDLLKKYTYNPITDRLVSIEDLKLADLDWSDIPNFNFDIPTIVASQTVTGGTGVLWPVIDYGGGLDSSSNIEVRILRPGVYLSQIFDRIASYTGYTFSGDRGYIDSMAGDFIPFSDSKLYDYQGTSWYDTGIQLSVVKNLPDFTVKDVMKDMMQRYFLTPVVDNYKKTIKFRSFDSLYTNKFIAKDWSNKFVNDSRTDEFSFGNYVQTNNLLWHEDQKLFTNGDAVLFVTNENLDATIDLITSIFAASDISRNVLGGQNTALINKRSHTTVIDFDIDTEPRIVRIIDAKPGNYNFFNALTGQNQQGPAKLGYFDPINWDNQLSNYGSGLKKLLAKARSVTRMANLTSLDVKDLDFFIPVYDEKEAKYYYINQVSNFIPGKLTKLQLIRM